MHNPHVLAWVASWRPWRKCQFCKYHGEFIASSGWLILNVMCWVLPFPEGSYFSGHLPTLKKLRYILLVLLQVCSAWVRTLWKQEERNTGCVAKKRGTYFCFGWIYFFQGQKPVSPLSSVLGVPPSSWVPVPSRAVRLLITEGDRGYSSASHFIVEKRSPLTLHTLL